MKGIKVVLSIFGSLMAIILCLGALKWVNDWLGIFKGDWVGSINDFMSNLKRLNPKKWFNW